MIQSMCATISAGLRQPRPRFGTRRIAADVDIVQVDVPPQAPLLLLIRMCQRTLKTSKTSLLSHQSR